MILDGKPTDYFRKQLHLMEHLDHKGGWSAEERML